MRKNALNERDDSLPKKPPKHRAPGAGAHKKYTELYDMPKGGNHLFVDVPRHRLDSVCSQIAKRFGRKFTVRRLPAGIGVWRLL